MGEAEPPGRNADEPLEGFYWLYVPLRFEDLAVVVIVLELPDQTIIAQIQPILPRVLDAFQTYLRELRPTDLEGSAGLYRLKDELTRRVNMAIAPNRINAVLFKEIVVQ